MDMFNVTSMRMLFAAGALMVGSSAFAAPLSQSYSTTAPVTPYVQVTTGSGATTDATLGGTFTYSNAYGTLPNTLYTPPVGKPYAGVNFNFYDDYKFTISGSTVSSVSSTINLGDIFAIDNLQARIYSVSGNTVPTLGAPTGVLAPWGTTNTAVPGGTLSYTVLSNVSLNPGTYVLELRGNVSGLAGGSYSGVLNVAPVPVPSALWLMSSAIVGLGTIGRKRRS